MQDIKDAHYKRMNVWKNYFQNLFSAIILVVDDCVQLHIVQWCFFPVLPYCLLFFIEKKKFFYKSTLFSQIIDRME